MISERAGELGNFLRTRRTALTPEAAGLSVDYRHRQVTGLRREEVAELASISPEFYMRIEQGRRLPSVSVLNILAKTLRLNDDERDYMFELAGKLDSLPVPSQHAQVCPTFDMLLEKVPSAAMIVVGPAFSILSWNAVAAALFVDFGAIPQDERNYLSIAFSNPAIRCLYKDWESIARTHVAHLRVEAAKYPADRAVSQLIDDTSAYSEDFRRFWSEHQVEKRTNGLQNLIHPLVGELSIQWETLECAAYPRQQLFVHRGEPGSSTEERLTQLVEWAGERTAAGESLSVWGDGM